MEEQQVKDLKTAIDGLIWLSAESVGTRFFVDVSVWASREEAQVEIVDVTQGAEAIYLDTTHGQPFTVETILALEDRLIEKLAALKAEWMKELKAAAPSWANCFCPLSEGFFHMTKEKAEDMGFDIGRFIFLTEEQAA